MAVKINRVSVQTYLPLNDAGAYQPPKIFSKEALIASYAAYEGLTFTQIEALLLEEMLSSIEEQKIPNTTLADKDRKWRAISAYQKAIRQQDLSIALRAGSAVFRSESSYFHRRMAVVMFEDVGLANLQLCALSLAIQSKMKWVRDNGDIQIPMYLTKVAATNPTDRSLCEIAVHAKRSPEFMQLREQLHSDSNYKPSLVASKIGGKDVIESYLASIALCGALTNSQGFKSESSPSLFKEVVEGLDLPNLVKYCIIKASSLGLEGLPNALHTNFNQFTDAQVVTRDIKQSPLVVGLPSYAYDKHVLEGKKAIGYFCKACQPVKEYLDGTDIANRVNAVGSAIFEEEGGNVLRESLVYPFQSKMLKAARRAHLLSSGVSDKYGEGLCSVVAANIDSLNAARKKVIS